MRFVFCFFMAVVWFVLAVASEGSGSVPLIVSQVWLVGGMLSIGRGGEV